MRLLWSIAAALGSVAAATGVAAQEITPQEIMVEAEPVDIPPARLDGAKMAGAWSLSSRAEAFGGFSGLVMRDGRLIAVSDRASLWTAEIRVADRDLTIAGARLEPLSDAFGSLGGRDSGDAEGLALTDGRLVISFERDHRIAAQGPDGVIRDLHRPEAFDDLSYNAGLEGLAALPGGDLIAIAEDPEDGAAPYWIISPGGAVTSGRLMLNSRHQVTGADLGPDGRLYLVLRDYSRLRGVSIRVLSYALADGHPVADSVREIAAFESASGIDNMEAISVGPGTSGPEIWLLSDDNFNLIQRTLLIRLDLG